MEPNQRSLFKSISHRAIAWLLPVVPNRVGLVLAYYRSFQTFPNLRNPKKFTEKIQHRKLFGPTDRMAELTDKVAVKAFVADRLGEEWVIPTLWHGDHLPTRSERRWPVPYVIKASHGCNWNHYVRSPEEENWDEIEPLTEKWLGSVYAADSKMERHYHRIKPQLLVEPYIGNGPKLPFDYKFLVFGGRVEYIRVVWEDEKKQTVYDRNWLRQPFLMSNDLPGPDVPPPSSLPKMINAAERLAEGFSYVRVDLYEIDGKPRFSEMTFTPGTGFEGFLPLEFDTILGSKWPDD